MAEKEYLTKEKYNELKEELDRLKIVVRPEVIQAIKEAREHGDLSENAEYEAARERQSFVETKIRQLEDKLARAKIINLKDLPKDKVVFGATIFLYDLDLKKEVKYTLVGGTADYKKGEISISSPIGKGLLGKQKNEIAEIKAPARTIRYKVINICSG
ncbi:MAG: transcription elongation factor GreA [bacterium]